MVKIMVRTFYFFTFFFIFLGITGFFLPFWHVLGWLGFKNSQTKYSHYISYYWAKLVSRLAGIKVTVHGEENIPAEGAVLFVSNHQGNFDIPVLLGYINKPKGFLAKMELVRIPILYSWMRKMGCVFIDRGNMRQSVKAVQECAEVIRNGKSMVVFPEGTRSKGPEMGEFKKGSLRLVEKAGVPVVPVSINGTYRMMEANGNRIRPGEVTVVISPPVYPDRLSREDLADFNSLIREIIEKNLPKI